MSKIILSEKNTRFTKKFLKNIQKLPPYTRALIQKKLEEILQGKRPANIKKLSNYPLADYRLKIDNFRLFLSQTPDSEISIFVACISRKNLY